MTLQNVKNPNFDTFRIPNLGDLKQNDIWMSAPMVNHKKYYKGEGDGFPQVWAVVSFMNLFMLVVRTCIKNVSTMH
jgi:hypothetical protein